MATDIRGNEIGVGDTVACLPHNNFNMIFVAEVVEMHALTATVKYRYPDGIFDGREETSTAHYDDMVVIETRQWPDVCHETHRSIRSSDASTFDVICDDCGATDRASGGWGKLKQPCKGTIQ